MTLDYSILLSHIATQFRTLAMFVPPIYNKMASYRPVAPLQLYVRLGQSWVQGLCSCCHQSLP